VAEATRGGSDAIVEVTGVARPAEKDVEILTIGAIK
jgi:hypothetical protein